MKHWCLRITNLTFFYVDKLTWLCDFFYDQRFTQEGLIRRRTFWKIGTNWRVRRMCSIISLFPRKLRLRTRMVARDIMKISRCKLQIIFYQELIYSTKLLILNSVSSYILYTYIHVKLQLYCGIIIS